MDYCGEDFLPDGAGSRRMTLRLEPAFARVRDLLFAYSETGGKWTVFWRFDLLTPQISKISARCGLTHLRLKDRLRSEAFQKETLRVSPVFSRAAADALCECLDRLYRRGLPKDVQKPHGLDGCGYSLRMEETGAEYDCWCVLPRGWDELAWLIDRSLSLAGVEPRDYGGRLTEAGSEERKETI